MKNFEVRIGGSSSYWFTDGRRRFIRQAVAMELVKPCVGGQDKAPAAALNLGNSPRFVRVTYSMSQGGSFLRLMNGLKTSNNRAVAELNDLVN